jgi:hypothetical protein
MLKLLDTTAFYDTAEPHVTLLDLTREVGGLEKKAAHEEIQAYLSTLAPKPGYTYLHINAMTAGEYHGSNRNADFFPEENLKKYYKTFETSPAYVYRSHINKDPAKSYGKVIFSIYNERMHRVELIAECPDEQVADLNARIQKGDFPTTSMACKTPADTCSICGNRAHTRQEYCQHLKYELNRLYPDGRKVFAVNDQPLKFFDISIVVRPADVNSSILQKVAYDGTGIGSAELAEMEGLTEDGFHKRAQLKKLSELIKEITDGCYVVGAETVPANLLGVGAAKDLPLALVHRLHHFDLNHVLASMADHAISPSISFLAELIARKKLGEGFEGIGEIVEEYLHSVPMDHQVPVLDIQEPEDRSEIVDSIIRAYAHESSLAPAMVEKRASNIGYNNNGPKIEPTQAELAEQLNLAKSLSSDQAASVSYAKLLLGLGGAALLAKYFITTQIEKNLRDRERGAQNTVKIPIVKQGSERLVACQLAKIAMVQSMPNKDRQSDKGQDAARTGISVTRRILINTKSKIGGKLAGLLRLLSIGSKITNLG